MKNGLLYLWLMMAIASDLQDRELLASDELPANQPIFCYLPLDSTKSDADELRSKLPHNGKQWRAVATRGVEFINAFDDIPSKSAMFDGMNLVELDGSSGLEAQNLTVELWFRSDQAWRSYKYGQSFGHQLCRNH